MKVQDLHEARYYNAFEPYTVWVINPPVATNVKVKNTNPEYNIQFNTVARSKSEAVDLVRLESPEHFGPSTTTVVYALDLDKIAQMAEKYRRQWEARIPDEGDVKWAGSSSYRTDNGTNNALWAYKEGPELPPYMLS